MRVEKPLLTSYEEMKIVNHKLMIRPEGTLALLGGKKVNLKTRIYYLLFFVKTL
jgi:hypothetical protein